VSAGIVSLLALDIVSSFCSSLEMVFISGGLRIKILFLGLADFCLSYVLESMTRIAFPAKLSPKRNAYAKKKEKSLMTRPFPTGSLRVWLYLNFSVYS